MGGDDDAFKIPRFNGRGNDDYNLWRIRVVAALKGKGLYTKLESQSDTVCTQEVKDKASAIIVCTLGDSALRVCQNEISDPLSMLSLLDKRYAPRRAASRISVLTSVYGKRYSGKENMSKYIDEYESLFAQLERMGSDASIPEAHKAPILLASMGHNSIMENTIAALRLKDIEDLTWEAVTSDLIQEWKSITSLGSSSSNNGKETQGRYNGGSSRFQNKKKALIANKGNRRGENENSSLDCGFCGKPGHDAENCFLNPNSPRCKLSEQAKKSMRALAGSSKSEKKEKVELHFGSAVILKKQYHAAAHARANPKILDSGASATFFKSKGDVEKGSYSTGSSSSVQLAAGSDHASCLGEGTVSVGDLKLPNSVHVDSLNNTLLSVGQICDQGNLVVFTAKEAVILNRNGFTADQDDVIMIANRNPVSSLYEVHDTIEGHRMTANAATRKDINLWHNRLVHANERVLRSLPKHCKDIESIEGKLVPCRPCHLGKGRRKSFKSNFEEVSAPGEIVHSDLAGKLPKSIDGREYIITFVDQYSRFTQAFGLSTKANAPAALEIFKNSGVVRRYFQNGIQRLHTDGGGEYERMEVEEATTTTADTPQHNPFAERINRTLLEPIRVILEQSGLSAKYWEFALDYVVYVKNRLPHSVLGCSPFETLTGKKPTLKYCRVFGCSAYVYVEKPQSKVHARSIEGIFLGCDDNGVYLVESLIDRKLLNSVHVTCDESSFPALDNSDSSSSGEDIEAELPDYDDEASLAESEEITIGVLNEESDTSRSSSRYPGRMRSQPERYGSSTANSMITIPITTTDDPKVSDAMGATSAEIKLWENAINDELKSLEEMKTWKIVQGDELQKIRSGRIKTLPTHVVLKIKRDEKGVPSRFKARVVAGGHLQVKGRDYGEVYAPVINYPVIMLMLAVVLERNWVAAHVDVKTAFLNGDIDYEVFVSHPFNLPSHLKQRKFYKLSRSLYGLKQAPLQWFLKLRESLINKLGYSQLKSDGAVFQKSYVRKGIEIRVIILCYVDDMIFISNSSNGLDTATSTFLEEFTGSKDPLQWYVSICIERGPDYIALSQTAYIEQKLSEYKLESINPSNIPMQGNFYDEAVAHETDPVQGLEEYREMIGSLQYLCTRTRPDISAAVGILSQYSSRPNAFLLKCLKRVFAYLKGTKGFRLAYNRSKTREIRMKFHCDSDFAGSKNDRKSRSGWVGFLNGGAIIWGSKKQSCTSLSTAEAEYVAASQCAMDIIWLRIFLAEIGENMSPSTQFFCDNDAAISWADNVISMRKAKHIEVRHHFIRDCVSRGFISVEQIRSDDNIADGFTKPLDKIKFSLFRDRLGVRLMDSPRKLQEEC